jgi:hypothetical protein
VPQPRKSADCRAVTANHEWRFVGANTLRDPSIVEAVRTLMTDCRDRLLHHDPVWLAGSADHGAAGGAADTGIACLLRREGRPIGYAPFTSGTRTLRFAIGELTLHRHRLPSLTLAHDISLAATSGSERADLIRDLFRMLADHMPRRRAVFLEGIPVDGALFTTAMQLATSGWIVVQLGQSYEHHIANLPPSFAEYERQLGSRSRKSLRYSQRKLGEHLDGAVRARRFVSREDVPEFVAAAQAISRKTYQWRLLGLGLRDAASLTARLTRAADHGWMRCYILYCGDAAAAFMLGYLYRGVYHYIDVGYDPDWAGWSVGSILQMEAMRDLLAGEDRPDWFDFSTGTGAHKARFGNVSHNEINLLLLRRSLSNKCLAGLYTTSMSIDRAAAKLAAALGVKAKLKKWLRRAA